MRRFIWMTAPWSAAFLAFFTGAVMAAGVVPVVFYKASDAFTAVLVVVFGVLTMPFGGLLGLGLKDRVAA